MIDINKKEEIKKIISSLNEITNILNNNLLQIQMNLTGYHKIAKVLIQKFYSLTIQWHIYCCFCYSCT